MNGTRTGIPSWNVLDERRSCQLKGSTNACRYAFGPINCFAIFDGYGNSGVKGRVDFSAMFRNSATQELR